MPFWMTALVATSILVLLILSVVRAFKTKNLRLLLLEVLAILGFAGLLNVLFEFPAPTTTVAKSPSSDLAVATALFVSMFLGMLAQFLYNHFAAPEKERKSFDWGLFVAPLFASPIVFIPLLAAMQNADIDLTRLTAPRLMVFLVAFQNGFFWKEFFDKKRKEAKQE